MRISDWSSDVCSSDLDAGAGSGVTAFRRRWRLWRIGPRNKSGVTENRRLPSLRAPAADGASNDLIFLPDLAPQFGEQRIARGRPLVLLERVEADADRDRDAFAADHAFAVPERGDRIEEAARAFGHRGADERLVAIVVQVHRDDRAALRQHALGQIRRALGDRKSTRLNSSH